MRLFIAIDFDDGMRRALQDVQEDMRSAGLQGRFSPIENLHLTLAFIGEYNYPDEILDIIDGIPFEPTDIRLDRMGRFDDLYWVGIADNPELSKYVKRLRKELSDHGIPIDRKKFSPHITVLRKAQYRKDRKFPGILVPEIAMEADHASLFRSDRGKNGMIYTELT